MQFKKIIPYIAIIFLGMIILLLIGLINLPQIMTGQVEKQLSQLLDSDRIECDITQIGMNQFHVSNIQLASGISIDSIEVSYGMKSLTDFELDTVKLSGLTVHAALDENNKIHVKGFDFPKGSKKSDSSSNSAYLPKKLVLNHGKMVVQAKGEEILIPFDALAVIQAKEKQITIQSMLVPFGQKIRSQVRFDLDKGITDVNINASALDLSVFNRFVSKASNVMVAHGLADLSLTSSAPLKKWQFNLSRIRLSQPEKMAVEQIDTKIMINKNNIELSGQFDLIHSIVPKMALQYNAFIELSPKISIDASIQNLPADKIVFAHSAGTAHLNHPKLRGTFTGTSEKGNGNLSLKFDSGRVVPAVTNARNPEIPEHGFNFKSTQLVSDFVTDFTVENKGVNLKFDILNQGLKARSGTADILFQKFTAKGQINLDKQFRQTGKVWINGTNGKILFNKQQLIASGINFKVPFSFPLANPQTSGTYSIPTISLQNKYYGSTKGNFVQSDLMQFKINGNVGLKALPKFSGRYDLDIDLQKGTRIDANVNVKPFDVTDLDLRLFGISAMEKALFKATLATTGKVVVRDHKVNSNLSVKITNGNFELPETNLKAKGISTRIEFVDLVNLRSLPSQSMRVDSIQVNKIKINDALIRFNVESLNSYLVENLRFKWCNGLVSSEAIRFPQKNEQYQLTLYCDRLELSQLLQQLGAFHSEGAGTLNGRIPIIYKAGNISFNNGFLFSTPGSGGRVAIANASKLTAGIPMNTPQFSQLDLAQEALKDFNYKWAKLKLNTIDNTLAVAMELDGKPSKTLPFKYQKEFGGFIRVDAASPGSNFQGIKLDVNLKLPFNEVMKFGNKLKSLFN